MSPLRGIQSTMDDFVQLLAQAGFSPAPAPSPRQRLILELEPVPSLAEEIELWLAKSQISKPSAEQLRRQYNSAINQLQSTTLDSWLGLVDSWIGPAIDETLITIKQCLQERFQNECRKCTDDLIQALSEESVKAAQYLKEGGHTESISKSRLLLESAFQQKSNISSAEKRALARETGLTPKQVSTWFNNARNRKARAERSERGVTARQKRRLSDQSLGRASSPVPSLISRSSSGSSSASSSGDESIWLTSGSIITQTPSQKPYEGYSPSMPNEIQQPFSLTPSTDISPDDRNFTVRFPTDMWLHLQQTETPAALPDVNPLCSDVNPLYSDPQDFLNTMDWPVQTTVPTFSDFNAPATDSIQGEYGLPQLFGDVEMAS